MKEAPTSAHFSIRWSHVEASKSYARPFMVQFDDDAPDGVHGNVAVNGAELVYYRQFQAAVLNLTGELFVHPPSEEADDPQRTWLDVLGALLPALAIDHFIPLSDFDDREGRRFRFSPGVAGFPWAAVGAEQLLEYQDVQAVLAHQTGSLYRNRAVEAVAADSTRQTIWLGLVRELLVKPPPDPT